jgi:Na+/H+ antiporter NhaD/arsenite permease-like protein
MLLAREDPGPVLARVEWSVLLFFAGLFVVVRGFALTGLGDRAWAALPGMDAATAGGRALLAGALAVGSNVVSNVPVVLVAEPHLRALGGDGGAWHVAAMATTFAGNLTLLGSAANIIVAEQAKGGHALGFLEHLRFGVLTTAVTLAIGVLLL